VADPPEDDEWAAGHLGEPPADLEHGDRVAVAPHHADGHAGAREDGPPALRVLHALQVVARNLADQLLQLRVEGDVTVALAALGAHGVAAADAYVIGATLTVPLHDVSVGDALRAIDQAGLSASDISTRQPTLDDVYLRLTGASAAQAA